VITARMIEQAAALLREGGLVVAPTDTVYGVCAHPACPAAVQRLFAVKGRPDGKPIPLLLADAAALSTFGIRLTPAEARLAEAFWPGALTLIVRTPDGSEGVRVPDHEGMRALLRAAGGVLRVTSANRSGAPPALTAEAARQALGERVDLILDDGPVAGGVASSVVRITAGGFDLLREGAISRSEIQEALIASASHIPPSTAPHRHSCFG
jgi:L-threonylcarbamoyladenylate synthase